MPGHVFRWVIEHDLATSNQVVIAFVIYRVVVLEDCNRVAYDGVLAAKVLE